MPAAAKSKPISSHDAPNGKRVSSNAPALSVAATEKDKSEKAESVAGGKPDKKLYEAKQMKLKAEIDVLQAKLVIYFST